MGSITWTVQRDTILKDFLKEQGISRRLFKTIKEQEALVTVNGKARLLWHAVKEGEEVRLQLPDEPAAPFMHAQELPLIIVYEDEHILVLDKQEGIAVIPSLNQPDGTVANGLLWHYQTQGLCHTVHIVTRLDRDTSGLMLIAKHKYAHSLLASAQKAGTVKRTYAAVCEGILEPPKGKIDAPIGRKDGSIIERTVRTDGQYAVTYYQRAAISDAFSLIEVKLETGRTHQIRVHFSHIGFPLAGDTIYGGSEDVIKRQALHSETLHFTHPISGKKMTFYSPIPADFLKLVQL